MESQLTCEARANYMTALSPCHPYAMPQTAQQLLERRGAWWLDSREQVVPVLRLCLQQDIDLPELMATLKEDEMIMALHHMVLYSTHLYLPPSMRRRLEHIPKIVLGEATCQMINSIVLWNKRSLYPLLPYLAARVLAMPRGLNRMEPYLGTLPIETLAAMHTHLRTSRAPMTHLVLRQGWRIASSLLQHVSRNPCAGNVLLLAAAAAGSGPSHSDPSHEDQARDTRNDQPVTFVRDGTAYQLQLEDPVPDFRLGIHLLANTIGWLHPEVAPSIQLFTKTPRIHTQEALEVIIATLPLYSFSNTVQT